MHAFTYHRPKNLTQAREIFAQADDATFLSGGHTLLPTLKQRLAAPSDLIDLWGLPELRGIAVRDGMLRIGGSMTHAEVAASDIVRDAIPVLAGLAGSIADRHVRHRGTMGGSVANNDPAADYPAAVLGLCATVITDRRAICADDYFTGLYETARGPDEIVVAVEYPLPLSAGYAKFRSAASRYALAAVFVVRTKAGVRAAVTGAGSSGVFRLRDAEALLNAEFSSAVLADFSVDPDGLLGDPYASAEYRAALVATMLRRAVDNQGEVQLLK